MPLPNTPGPNFSGEWVKDPKKLPLLLAIPVVVFLVLGLLTGLLDFTPGGGEVVPDHFFSTWLVDMIFIPLSIWVVAVFALGLKRFIRDIHENAIAEGKTDKFELNPQGFVQALIRVLPRILRHDRFRECGENQERSTAHLLVFYGFIALFIVTSIFFVFLYVLQIPGPYSQLNPVKWLANLGGIALIVGGILMITNRQAKADTQVTSYKDWLLIGLVLGLGTTGLLTEIIRLTGLAGLTYFLYFVHLMIVFFLFAYLPFSKLAHLVYRTAAMAYAEYANR